MSDPDVVERWLTQAFAHVKTPPGVEAWRDLTPRQNPMRNSARRLMAIGLTAGIAAVLFIASVAGTLALTHSHPSPSATVHSSSAPAATHAASPSVQATASACSRLQTPGSPKNSLFQFDPAGAAIPAISCARAIATLLCPPHGWNGPCWVVRGTVKAQLVRLSIDGRGLFGEDRGPSLPFVGPPFLPSNLLVWHMTFVPTVCIVESDGVSGSDIPEFGVFSTRVSTACRTSFDYLIDASTGDFVYFDTAPRKAG
jgi:hypothetical protein